MKTNTTKFIWLAFLTTLVGFGFFVYLTLHHYQLHYGFGAGTALCNLNSAVNCDSISASSYSELSGIPMAVLGLASHLVLLILLLGLAVGWADDVHRVSRLTFYLGSANLLVSLIMAVISFALLKTLCLFCTGTYITALLLFFFLLKGLPESGFKLFLQDVGEALTSHKIYLVPTLGVLVGAWFLDLAMEKKYGATDIEIRAIELYSRLMNTPQVTFDDTLGISKGAEGTQPSMKIVEFIDFRCPHCRVASSTLEAFLASRPDVRLTLKTFPLDSTCNPQVQQGDGISCHLAYLAHCSEKLKGLGYKAARFIFQNQDHFRMNSNKMEMTQKVAENLQIDSSQMESCTKDGETFSAIQKQAQEGKGISGTPAIFINGRLLNGVPPLPIFQRIYQKAVGQL